MPSTLHAVLEWTVEYRQWGWNAGTVSAVLMAVLTFPESWGFIEQGRTIWREKKAESVSNYLFSYLMAFYFACAVYGFVEKHSAAMVFNALIGGLAQIPTLYALARYNNFTRQEIGAGFACTLMPLWEYWMPYRGWSYLVFSVGVWWALYKQLRELLKSGKTGELDPTFLAMISLSTAAWDVFTLTSFREADYFLWTSQGVVTLFIVCIDLTWCRYWLWERKNLFSS